MTRTALTLTTFATLVATTHLAAADAHVEKRGGIAVRIEADGKKDNGGELVHAFTVTATSSNRKDDKQVEGTIHLLDDGGDLLSDCAFSTTVLAAGKKTLEVLCYESRDWSSFTVDLTVTAVAKDAD